MKIYSTDFQSFSTVPEIACRIDDLLPDPAQARKVRIEYFAKKRVGTIRQFRFLNSDDATLATYIEEFPDYRELPEYSGRRDDILYLDVAIETGKVCSVEYILDSPEGERALTPRALWLACSKGDLRIAQAILARFPQQLNTSYRWYSTPLDAAVKSGNRELVSYLEKLEKMMETGDVRTVGETGDVRTEPIERE